MDYFEIEKHGDLFKELYCEIQNIYPDIDINQNCR